MTETTTQRELSVALGIPQAEISKALTGVPGVKPSTGRVREKQYDTAQALKAVRTWLMRRRAHYIKHADALGAQAGMVGDEMRRYERERMGQA